MDNKSTVMGFEKQKRDIELFPIWKLRDKYITAFTIVEIIVAAAIVSIAILGTYGLYLGQQRSYVNQQRVSQLQQQMRVALNTITREVRMAGYDPQEIGIFGLTQAAADTISFTYDANENGILDTNEQYEFRVGGSGTLEYSRDGGSNWNSLPGEVVSLKFIYYDASAGETATLADIRTVKTKITGRIKLSAASDVYRQQTLSCRVRIRNYD